MQDAANTQQLCGGESQELGSVSSSSEEGSAFPTRAIAKANVKKLEASMLQAHRAGYPLPHQETTLLPHLDEPDALSLPPVTSRHAPADGLRKKNKLTHRFSFLSSL